MSCIECPGHPYLYYFSILLMHVCNLHAEMLKHAPFSNCYAINHVHTPIYRQKLSIASLQLQLRENESCYLALMKEIRKKHFSPTTKANMILVTITVNAMFADFCVYLIYVLQMY